MKHALIIAGSRGLGFGLVREYLARGWHVTATARTPSDELVALRGAADGRLVIESLEVTLVAHSSSGSTAERPKLRSAVSQSRRPGRARRRSE